MFNITYVKIIYRHRIIHFNKNDLFFTYFAEIFMIIVVYLFEIYYFMQLHIGSYNLLHFEQTIQEYN